MIALLLLQNNVNGRSQGGGLLRGQQDDERSTKETKLTEGDNGREEIWQEERQALQQSDGAEEISRRQEERQTQNGGDGREEISRRQEERQTLKQRNGIGEISRRHTLKQSDEQNGGEPEVEEDGNRRSKVNILRTQIFEELQAESLPYSAIRSGERDASCEGKYIYVYDLPPEFNIDLAARCDSLFPAFNLCDFFADSGTGKPVDTHENGSQIFVPAGRWFNTHQYALELVSHARIKRYKCLTENPDQAALFYIPFYAGLDVIRWNFARDSTNEKRDALSMKLLRWLEKQPSWRRRRGRDHVLVLGKISWDFRRQEDGGEWGSRLLELPETQDVTKVLIERNPWAKNDIGVPHPTFFHPRSADDINTWLEHIRSQSRTSLVTFVGKERPGTANVRGELVKQCRYRTEECRFVQCNHNLCQNPAFVTEAFLTTHFCMQPVGDSPTRRSVFDSLIAGCIPVLFHPCTAYVQYPWHLPKNESSWSVYISEDEVKRGEGDVVDVLRKISVAERDAMRATIVSTIIPGLLYSAPGSDVFPYRDAFDISIDQLLHRVSKIVDQGAVI